MTGSEAEILLQKKFNLQSFHERQWETISRLLNGEKILLIEKTGFGKSLCYQFPAVTLPGLTVVFSPLISLMRDQVNKLLELKIPAQSINSSQNRDDKLRVLDDARNGRLKILYIAPERQLTKTWLDTLKNLDISMVVVDEAHCISVWGHDFRPAYRKIVQLIKPLPYNTPVLAVTATATKQVENDIAGQIGDDIKIIRGNLMRENLKLFVGKVTSEDEKMVWLGENLRKIKGTGIVYTGTRLNTEIYSKWFNFLGIPSARYNAGLESEERKEIENGFLRNKWKAVISTNALGMGIDKPDIRFVIHTQIPPSPLDYYQEIGRAGRDGKNSYAILFYNDRDKKLLKSLLLNGLPSVEKYLKVEKLLRKKPFEELTVLKKTGINLLEFKTIKKDLTEQELLETKEKNGIIKFFINKNSPGLDTISVKELNQSRRSYLKGILDYAETSEPRMKFLCGFLGDDVLEEYSNCDNSGLRKISVNISEEWNEKLREFRERYRSIRL